MRPSKHRWWRTTIVTLAVSSLMMTSIPPLGVGQEDPVTNPGINEPVAEQPAAEAELAPEEETTTPDEQETPEPATAGQAGFRNVGPANAPSDLVIGVKLASDGTESFDPTGGSGNDTGPNNGIVRVNDTVTYEVEIGSEQHLVNDAGFEVTFPKGIEIVSLPGQCQAGSSITPPSVGAPTLPLTNDSLNQLEAQTLRCKVGNVQASLQKIFVVAKVSNLVKDNQELKVTKAIATIADAESAVVPEEKLPTVTASSRLQWDISKIGVGTVKDQGYTYGPAVEACPWDTKRLCQLVTYSLVISGSAGGKGAMPAIGDINFTEDLSPEGLFGLSGEQLAKYNANLDKYGSRIWPSNNNYEIPGNKVGQTGNAAGVVYTEKNSARDSGSILVEGQPLQGYAQNDAGHYGKPLNITIRGADMTLTTYPTEVARPVGNTAGVRAIAVAHRISVYTPVETVTEFGFKQGNTWTLKATNRYRDLNITGFDGATENSDQQPNFTATEDGKANDYRSRDLKVELGNGFSKHFTGVPGLPGNMTPEEFYPGWSARGEGPPGGATLNSGAITVAPTQNILSQLLLTGSNTAYPATNSSVMCDAWDKSKLHLHAQDVPATTFNAPFQAIGSGGQAVWVSGYNNVKEGNTSRYAKNASEVPQIRVQYSPTPGGKGAASECSEANGPWYDNPADLPENDPALAAQKIYSGVGRVRVHVVLPKPIANSADLGTGVRLITSINLRVAEYQNAETGDILPNYGGVKAWLAENKTLEEIVNDPAPWTQSSYDPSTHRGGLGDRLTLEMVRVRIDKKVRKENQGEYSDTPPVVRGDGAVPDKLQFRIAPSLSSGALTPGITKEVWVEECIAAQLRYVSASITPALVSETTPSDAKRPTPCAPGETYVRWVYEEQEVNRAMEPIILTTEVLPEAISGTYTTDATIWGEDDKSTIQDRSNGAPFQISNQNRIALTKRALVDTVQVNHGNQDNYEENSWRVNFFNSLPNSGGTPYTNPVVIDVLPRAGLGTNNFHGTIALKEVTVRKGDKGADTVQVLYTKAANPERDPRHVSNQPGGSTAWCDKPTGGQLIIGQGDCPDSLEQVTAVRLQRGGSFATGDSIEFDVTLVGKDNQANDVYDNFAGAFVNNYQNVVLANAVEKVVSSTLGDTAWLDINSDGIQDADEPGLPNITVTLEGEDDLGNPVRMETTTNDQGKYWFRNLRSAGSNGYVVTFSKPANLGFTTQTVGSDRAIDSDVDTATGQSAPIRLARDTVVDTIDAGYVGTSGFKIKKIVSGPGAEFAHADSFSFSYVCRRGQEVVKRSDADISVTLPDGQTQVESETITGIPLGVECEVTETTFGKSDSDAQSAPTVKVAITVDPTNLDAPVPVVELQNKYSAAQITVEKRITGSDLARMYALGKQFRVQVRCTQATGALIFEKEVMVTGEQTVPVPGLLPAGARCHATELDNGGAIAVAIDHDAANPLVVPKSDTLQTLPIVVTNEFEVPHNPYYVRKTVLPAGFTGHASYKISYECQAPGRRADGSEVAARGTIDVPANSEVLLGNFPLNAQCMITDEDRLAAEVAGYSLEVELDSNAQTPSPTAEYHMSVTNTYARKLGAIKLSKAVTGNAAELLQGQRFRFSFTCQAEDGQPVVIAPVELAANDEITLTDIPVGECEVTETPVDHPHAGLSTKIVVDGTETVGVTARLTIADQQTAMVAATNEYTRKLSSFSVRKVNTGDAGNFLDPVSVDWVCQLPEGGERSGSVELVPGAPAQTVSDIPTGSECRLVEPNITHQLYTITPSFDKNNFTLDDDPIEVTVTNHYLRNTGGLVIAKMVAGAVALAPKEFTFRYTCTDVTGAATRSGEVTVPAGQSRTITDIPTGNCEVVEQTTDPQHVDRVTTFSINDGQVTDGMTAMVSVDKDATATVRYTNTYTPHTASFKLRKKVVTDQPSPLFDAHTFTFNYVCAAAYAGGPAPQGVLSVMDGQEVSGPQLPIGTKCTITEQRDSAEVSGFILTVPEATEVEVGATAEVVELRNTYTRETGGFSIAKEVTGSGSKLAATKQFHFTYTCTAKDGIVFGPKSVAVAGGKTVTVTDIPTGDCVITEDDPSIAHTDVATSFTVDGQAVAENQPVKVAVTKDSAVKVVATNNYERHTAGFSVVKRITGDLQGATTSYKVDYTCTLDAEGFVQLGTLELVPGEKQEITGLPTGAKCVLSEVPHQVADFTVTAQFDQPQFELDVRNEVKEITLTNHYERHRGGFIIAKQVVGDAVALAPKEFRFDYVCTDRRGAQVATGTVTVPAGQSVTVSDIPTSTCAITEQDSKVALTTVTTTFAPGEKVEVTEGATAEVKVTNTYTAVTGTFQVRKKVEANREITAPEFRFSYTCQPAYPGAIAPTGTLVVPGDGTLVTGPKLPIGTECEVSELIDGTTIDGFDHVAPAPQTVTITADETLSLEFVNTYTARVGTFSIVKKVRGSILAKAKTFRFTYTCTDGSQGQLEVRGNGSPVVAENAAIAVGARCTVTEDEQSAQHFGSILVAPKAQEFTIGEKNQVVPLEFRNTYVPVILIPPALLTLIPKPEKPSTSPTPSTSPSAEQQPPSAKAQPKRSLAQTGVFEYLLALVVFGLVITIIGAMLVRRSRD